MKIDLGSIQQTLLVPLYSRAVETEKAIPIISDPIARDIVKQMDFDFSRIESGMEQGHQLVWPIRAYNFDLNIRSFIKEHPDGVIVNIGAGLDTSFYRIDNGEILWFNLDMPDVIHLRKELIPWSDREINIASSVFDFAWIDKITASIPGRPVLLMAAGVLVYFEENELEGLFRQLAKSFPEAEFIFDTMAWLTVWGANRSIMKKSGMDKSSPLKWYCKKASRLKKWISSLKIIDEYPMFSKLDLDQRMDKRIARDMKIANLLKLYNIVRISW